MKTPGCSFGGEYRFVVLDANRNVKRETDWVPNLVTNGGLDQIGAAALVGAYCRIGTGTTTPVITDSALVSQSAFTSNIVASTNVNNGASNYETANTTTYEFALGAVVGNMAEVGVGWATTGATLFSRALIVDGGGSPTTITVLSSEILQVVYRLTMYPNLSDSTGSVVIGGVTYTYTARATGVATALVIGPTQTLLGTIFTPTAYSGSIGAVTASPAGTSTSLTAGSFSTYTASNYYRDYTVSANLATGNVSGGIKSIRTSLGGSGSVFNTQIEFSTAIPKDNTKVLALTLRQAWSRH